MREGERRGERDVKGDGDKGCVWVLAFRVPTSYAEGGVRVK